MTNILQRMNKGYLWFAGKLEKYLIALVIVFFIGGILSAKYWNIFGRMVSDGFNIFIDAYGYIAPIAIFVIIAPVVAKMLKEESGKFGTYAVKWLITRRFLAIVFAVIFTTIIFGFPLLPKENVSIIESATETLKTVITMSYTSPFLIAIWIGLISAFISMRVNWLYKILSGFSDKFEQSGQYFVPLIPFFMLAVGAYVYYLPTEVSENMTGEAFSFSSLNILGISVNPNTATGMIAVYFLGAILVGIACFIWHFILLAFVKLKCNDFSIIRYFKDYWIKVYPLLWATSSEALATPLNLYLTKEHFPYVKKVVRRFIVGMGSYININGTLICVVVLGGVVASILGLSPSLFEWLIIIPIIFLLGFAVPGIPGELVLFAGPIAILLSLSPEMTGIFIALYVGLQLGLPDSFRTGNNSTDDCLCSILLNKPYEEKFATPLYNEVGDKIDDSTFQKAMEKILSKRGVIHSFVDSHEFKRELKKQLIKEVEQHDRKK